MKLLIFTQKIDKDDSVLGFFHTWVNEIAKKTEEVLVICLYKGNYDLPKNVTVFSLGKERGVNKFSYIVNLYRYLFLVRGTYNKVFIHMNQEYIVLAGLYWKIKRIPVYFWRNHPVGNFFTKIAVLFSTKIFCTSKMSFVAKYKKTVIMPVGNDTALFSPILSITRKKHSVCMLGRITPIKHIELGIEAIRLLVISGFQVSLTIIGSCSDKDTNYLNSLREYIFKNKLSSYVFILDDVPLSKHPEVFSSYEINLNLTDAGSFDKTIVGGTSCGAIPLVSNKALQGLLPDVCVTSPKPKDIAESLKKLLDPHIKIEIQKDLEIFVKSQSLDALIDKLFIEIS